MSNFLVVSVFNLRQRWWMKKAQGAKLSLMSGDFCDKMDGNTIITKPKLGSRYNNYEDEKQLKNCDRTMSNSLVVSFLRGHQASTTPMARWTKEEMQNRAQNYP